MLSVNFLGLRSVIFTTCDSYAAISFHATSLCLWNMEPVDYSPSSFSFICIILLIWKPEEISCHKNHLKNERLSAKTSVISLYLSYLVNIVLIQIILPLVTLSHKNSTFSIHFQILISSNFLQERESTSISAKPEAWTF